jgi:hypothetical protein
VFFALRLNNSVFCFSLRVSAPPREPVFPDAFSDFIIHNSSFIISIFVGKHGAVKFSIITPSFRNSAWLKVCIASVAGPLTQRFEDPGCQLLGVEVWNTFMGLAIFQTVVLLLDRVRHKNILFAASYQL